MTIRGRAIVAGWVAVVATAGVAGAQPNRPRATLHAEATESRLAPRCEIGLVDAVAAQELAKFSVSESTGLEHESQLLFGATLVRPPLHGSHGRLLRALSTLGHRR